MPRKKNTIAHHSRNRRQRKEKRKPKQSADKVRKQKEVRTHHQYGNIPLIRVTEVLPNGHVWEHLAPDPDFKPPIPTGAVRGDIRKQAYCPICWFPKYYYTDENKRCIQCGRDFVFAAAEQKFWYESLGFNFYSTAIRCRDCRRQRRSEKMLNTALDEALKQATQAEDDPLAHLEVARATVAYRERFGRGNLNRAIASARTAARLSNSLPEALYWEARCHAMAGREKSAQVLLEQFIQLANGKRRLTTLKANAISLMQ